MYSAESVHQVKLPSLHSPIFEISGQKNAWQVGIIGQYSPACSKNTDDKYTIATPNPGIIYEWIS